MAKKPPSVIVHVRKTTKIKEGSWYFIWRRGWYRPGAKGYTDDFAQAGLFTAEEARGHMKDCEGVSAVPVKPMLPLLNSVLRERIHQAHALATILNHFQ